jgi:N-acetylglutamate synthase-like GNAT family acetyltransferase
MVRIVPFEAKHQTQVIELILAIQRHEYGIDITANEQPDLLDIEGFYSQRKGNFWVALCEDEVVGTIALLDIGNAEGALRKMFVKSAFRGKTHQTASLLLKALLEDARQNGFKRIFLGTTSLFLAAHRFYEKNGFELLPKEALPQAFPIMVVDSRFYVKAL